MSKKHIEKEEQPDINLVNSEIQKWGKKMQQIEENTGKLLQIKRHRDLSGWLEDKPIKPLHVYLDYWIDESNFIPIAIRVYHEERDTIECFIYEVRQDILEKIKKYYINRTKKPYWINFIADSTVAFVIGLAAHFEKYNVSWMPSESTVHYVLKDRHIKLFTLFDHVTMIENVYECYILHVYYVKSEDVYKIDFLKDYKGLKMSSVDYNNMAQAITSIKTRIEKVINTYPNIVDENGWKELSKYFKISY